MSFGNHGLGVSRAENYEPVTHGNLDESETFEWGGKQYTWRWQDLIPFVGGSLPRSSQVRADSRQAPLASAAERVLEIRSECLIEPVEPCLKEMVYRSETNMDGFTGTFTGNDLSNGVEEYEAVEKWIDPGMLKLFERKRVEVDGKKCWRHVLYA